MSLIGSVLVVFGIASQQVGQGIFDRVILKPTGDNGYEEYCRACDVAVAGGLRGLLFANRREDNPLTLLAARRAASEKLFIVLDLISAGSRKKVFDPRTKLDFSTLYPELSHFKDISRLFGANMYVQFADGNSVGGCSTFIEAMKFSNNISQQTLISLLVASSLRAELQYELLPNLPAISLQDAARIEAYFDAVLRSEPKIASVVRREHEIVSENLDVMLNDVENFLVSEPEQEKVFEALSEAERSRLVAELRPALKSYYDGLIGMLIGTEKEWRTPNSPALTGNAKIVFEGIVPAFDLLMKREIIDRTRSRLWRLAMRIVQFRWVHNRLPKSLDELEAPTTIADPTNGGEFIYKTFELNFELSSKGSSISGPIKMGYVPPPDSGAPTN